MNELEHKITTTHQMIWDGLIAEVPYEDLKLMEFYYNETGNVEMRTVVLIQIRRRQNLTETLLRIIT